MHQVLQALAINLGQTIASKNCKPLQNFCQTIAIRALQNIGSNLGTILHCKLYHQLAQMFAISSVKLLQSMHSTLFCQLSQTVAKPLVKLSQSVHCTLFCQLSQTVAKSSVKLSHSSSHAADHCPD